MELHKITPFTGELTNHLHKASTSYRGNNYIAEDGWILPKKYTKFYDTIENFEIRDDDVWICGFPRTGTTWTQEMVWFIANNLDFERGKVPMDDRTPFFDHLLIYDEPRMLESRPTGIEPTDSMFITYDYIANMPSPRVIKTHLPAHLLPRQLRSGETKAKIVYVCRNAKDTCISLYHFSKLLGHQRSIEDHYTRFLADKVCYSPFWKSALGYWNKRNDSNVLFLKYDDMKKDFPAVVKKAAIFLGKNLTNDQVSSLVEHLSFESMKVNPSVNKETLVSRAKKMSHNDPDQVAFIRNGTVGQWKDVMPPEIIKRFDDWTYEHLKGTGLSF